MNFAHQLLFKEHFDAVRAVTCFFLQTDNCAYVRFKRKQKLLIFKKLKTVLIKTAPCDKG